MQPTPAVYHPPSCDPSFQRRGEPYGYASPVIGRPPLQHHWSAPGAFRLPPNPRSASPATASAAQVQQPPSQFERPVGFSERRRACPTSLPAPLQLTSRSYRGPPSPYYAVHEFSAGPAPPLPGPASASLEHRQREWTATTSASTTAGMSSRRTAQDYGKPLTLFRIVLSWAQHHCLARTIKTTVVDDLCLAFASCCPAVLFSLSCAD